MKKLNDENIQKLLEQGFPGTNATIPSSDDKDFKVYQLLFKELRKEPAVRLPRDFSAKIVAQLQGQKNRASERKFYILIAVIALAGFAGAYIMLAVMNYEYAFQLAITLFDHGSIFLFCLFCFLVIQYLDQKLVKPYQSYEKM